MSLAPWRVSLASALHHNRARPDSRYFQLATIRPDGIPANRTVVFRGFQSDTNILKVITDRRSSKVHHLEHCPWVEACWYFTKTREQFRLTGQLRCINKTCSEEVNWRLQTWQSISDSARSQFYWPHPGQPRSHQSNFETVSIDTEIPPDSFCLLLLNPIIVDHLKLRGAPQHRYHYEQAADGTWSVVTVNP